ncbi:alpha/beta-hydrolase [Trichoderma chlorosporum]
MDKSVEIGITSSKVLFGLAVGLISRNRVNRGMRWGGKSTTPMTHISSRLSKTHQFSSPTMEDISFKTETGSVLQYFKRGNGPTMIVAPPAWGLSSKYLQETLAPLEQTFTLIYLEFRANGKSTRPDPSHMSCWHLADDIEYLRKELRLEKIAHLLAHSGGGTIALWYAIRYPDKVDRLVLLNHTLEGFNDSKSRKEAIIEKSHNPKMHAALKAWTSQWEDLSDEGFAQVIRSFLPVYFYDPDASTRSTELNNVQSVPLWNYKLLHGKDQNINYQEPELGNVTAKTLLIFCRADPVCTPTQGIATHEGIPGSKLIIYEQCGHFPWMEKGEETFRDIIQFCTS